MTQPMLPGLWKTGFGFVVLWVGWNSFAYAIPGGVDWSAVPEAERSAAYAPINARSGVSSVRQALSTADAGGVRAFDADADSEALRGTFRLAIPLLDVRGRTESTVLKLNYQARIWFGGSEANMAVLDGDVGSAPGWSIGIPKLLGGVLIEADGSRRPARRTTTNGNALEDVESEYVATDGSNVTYRIRLTRATRASPVTAVGEVRYPNGAVVTFAGHAGLNPAGRTSVLYSRLYAVSAIDPSGNATTYEYSDLGHSRAAARVSRMVDPLGRSVRFHYNGQGQLSAVTAESDGAQARTLVRLTYRYVAGYHPRWKH
jgi:YD repeat-containing protein